MKIVETHVIDNLMSEVENIERVLGLISCHHSSEGNREALDCVHELQNKSSEKSVHAAEE
jgi:hypothetical protein